MKLIYGLLILLIPTMLVADTLSKNNQSQKSPKWVPIYGFKHPTSTAFVDANTATRKSTEINGDFGSAGILLVHTKSVPALLSGETVMVKSVLKYMVMDCKTGLLAPAVDLYFSVDKPNKTDKPLGIIKYSDLAGAEMVSMSSLIYHTLCPVYI